MVKGSDGAVYFIRDELLEACRVEGEYVDHVDKLLNSGENEVQGFAFDVRSIDSTSGSLQPVAYVSGDLVSSPNQDLNLNKVASTVMCPW